jgi:hypothetical protein
MPPAGENESLALFLWYKGCFALFDTWTGEIAVLKDKGVTGIYIAPLFFD